MTLLTIPRTLIFGFIIVVSLLSNHVWSADSAPPLRSVTELPRQVLSQTPVEMIAYDFCAYSIDGTGELLCNVALVAVDGSKRASIDNAIDPAWSSDGSRIAFAQYGQPGLFVLNLSNWSIASVHNDGESPAWSPDSTKLAFSAGELFVMGADGSNVVQLTNNVGFRGQPAWSSDGARIAFDCEVESGNFDICSVNADGTSFIRLTSDPGWASGASFSPDGFAIAFADGLRGIAIMNLDGTGIRPVGAGTFGFQPTWSPDSSRIAFVQPHSGCFEADWRICLDTVFIMNRDGGELRQIASGNRPTWGASLHPVALFNQQCNGLDCAFNGSGSWGGNRTIESYTWDFGDGMSGSDATVSHAYSAPGTYRVTLTVTDDAGATGSRSQDINIDGNLWPTARFTYACIGWRCTFDGAGSSDPDGTIASYSWSFGGGEGTAYGQTVSHTYRAAGPFTATLWVTDNGGGEDIQQHVINLVANEPPSASFTIVCTALTCRFDGSTSSDPDGMIENYTWNFGDGTGASAVTATHTYAYASTFAVSLTVRDNIGATSVQQSHVTVSYPMHIGDLDGVRTNQKNSWTTSVTVTVHNANHSPVANATVHGAWSIGGTGSCTTGSSGQCILSKSTIPKKTSSVMFTIVNVTKSTYLYTSVDNHDPDGDSNGTNVTVRSQ